MSAARREIPCGHSPSGSKVEKRRGTSSMDFNEAFEKIAAERGIPAAELRAQIDAAIHQ